MRASSLVVVLIVAKALTLAGRELPVSVWTLPAYVWHDVAVGAAFYAIDRGLGRPRALWAAYALVAGLAAVNVPVTLALSSPVTVPMLRAAGGPIADSFAHYVTASNLARIAAVCLVAALAPAALERLPRRLRGAGLAAGLALLVVGPFAAAEVSTRGLHRNAVTSLAASVFPRVAGVAREDEWRVSPYAMPDDVEVEDLTMLRGRAAGRSVLLVALESTAARYLASYGAAEDPTPNLTRLARGGLVFENAYVVYPESIKGLFATLCSRDPAFDVAAEVHAASPCAPLARILAQAGYRTALFHSGRFDYLGMRAVVAQQGFDRAEDAGDIGGNLESSFGVDEPATVAGMLEWIDTLDPGEPFFVTYLPIAGHHPYAAFAPGPFEGTSEIDAYRNALYDGDRALGALLAGLRARGRDDDTVVVAFGDHGEAFGEREGNVGHTFFLFDENIRVPLVISGLPPAASTDAPAPSRVERVASVTDIAPTILDLLGLPAEPAHEGVSLLEPAPRMALFFTDYALGWLGLRDSCWKYLFEIDSRRSMLFDVCNDPDETRDLSADHAALVETYRARLEAWAAARRAAIADRD
jgi:arylsulfatase A-like enzyme